MAALAADCTIVNDFEYVPLPSVLVPVTVTVPTRSEAVVFCAKVTLTEEDSMEAAAAESPPDTVAFKPVRFW